jgi:phosphate transport system substrate-binding protein
MNANHMKVLIIAVCVWMVPVWTSAQMKPEVDSGLKPYRSSGTKLTGNLSIGTSESIQRLIDIWSHEFRHHHQNVEIRPELIRDPDAPDAFSKGVLPIIEGANLVALSWPMREEGLQLLRERMGVEPIKVTVALDAIVLLVHHRNPVAGLTLSQVGAIFGEVPEKETIDQWQQVGVNGKLARVEINRYGRDRTSGTFAAFKKMGLGGGQERNDVRPQPGSMSVVIEVGSDEAGIGYAATGFARRSSKVRVVPLARTDGEGFITPTNETVLNGEYPLMREVYIYAMPRQDGTIDAAAKEFITFVLSRDGQKLVMEDGFFPLPARQAEQTLRSLEASGGRRSNSGGRLLTGEGLKERLFKLMVEEPVRLGP